LEKVDDFPILEAVDEVSDGTTQNQRKWESKDLLILLDFNEEEENASNRDQRNNDKEYGTESTSLSPEDSKSSACISHMGEIEEPMDDLNPMIESQLLDDHIFRPLIQQENPETENQKDPIFMFHLTDTQFKVQGSKENLSAFTFELSAQSWIASTHLWQMA
jgi:hypothetical protein